MPDPASIRYPRDGDVRVVAWDGCVLIEGPGNLALTVSPDSAEEMCRKIGIAVAEARQQQPLGDRGAE